MSPKASTCSNHYSKSKEITLDMKNKVMEMIKERENHNKSAKTYSEKWKRAKPKLPTTRKSSFTYESMFYDY